MFWGRKSKNTVNMINSPSGIMGSSSSIKRESSCTKLQQISTSPNESSSSVSKSKMNNNIIKPSTPPTSSGNMMEQISLSPPSLEFPPPIKFELDGGDGDAEVQSPDNSMWDSLFSDHFESAADFMIMSPVRNLTPLSPSPYNYNYAQAMQGQSLSGCSPPRSASQLGAFSSTCSTKGKGLSPLHKVFSSVNNQYMQQPENFSLPAIEEFLDDYNNNIQRPGGFGAAYNKTITRLSQTQTSNYDIPSSSSNVIDQVQGGSMFCEAPSAPAARSTTTSTAHVPLSQQLQHERQQEKKQHQHQQQLHHHLRHNLIIMPDLPFGYDQLEQDSGLQLVHLLLACAEAVSKEDYMLARRYLHHLNRVVTPLGDSMQRVASCFTEALSARLAATLTTTTTTATSSSSSSATTSASKPAFNPFPPNCIEILKIYQIVYQACPYIKFAHFTANQAIFEAFESEDRVHIIDLDILQGYQWPAFMQALSARPGGAPFLRITGVGPSLHCVEETGRCLTELAHSLHVRFEFHAVGEQLEDLKPHMFNRRVGEALAVNSVNRLHRVPAKCLGNILSMIRDQAPNIFTVVEQEASHNGPYFLGRFLEALHYYSAIFDSLDATFPADSVQRAKVEQYIFAPEISNIVACEGAERTERHERLEKWRKVMEGKGFRGVPLSASAVTQSKILLGLYSCDGYRLTEDKGCLLLGWQDRALVAASAWRC